MRGCFKQAYKFLYYATGQLKLEDKTVYLHGRTLKVLRLLGEGGYSFVYLVRDAEMGEEFALKKMLCQSSEHLQLAKREIDTMHAFRHPHLLELLDSDTQNGTSAGSSSSSSSSQCVVNLLFRAYKDGTVLDLVESCDFIHPLVLLEIFLQVCEGARAMHKPSAETGSSRSTLPHAHRDIKPHNILLEQKKKTLNPIQDNDGDEEQGRYDLFHAVLMDFGSARVAQVDVCSRSDALKQQEEAEAHSTGTYRPPELFDTPSQCRLDERTDVWALGCTLYYMLYGESPFEYVLSQAGGSLALAVISNKVSWPSEESLVGKDGCLIEKMADLCKFCMVQDPQNRPFVGDVIEETNKLVKEIRSSSSGKYKYPSTHWCTRKKKN
jgi:serine/threonine kinase 16